MRKPDLGEAEEDQNMVKCEHLERNNFMNEYKAPGFLHAKQHEIVPEGVEMLCAFAFGSSSAYGNSCPLRTVSLPSTLKKIGSHAFAHCKHLESLVIPHGVEEIESDAFKGCVSLKNITFPSTLKELGTYCFDGCTSLEKIIVEDIIAWAKVKTYDYSGWKVTPELWLRDMSIVRFDVPLELVCGGGFRYNPIAFRSFSNIREVIYPSGAMSASLDFSGCVNLEKVIFPAELEGISLENFYECKNLKEIKFPQLVSKWCCCAFYSPYRQNPALDLIPETDGVKYVGGWCVGGSCEIAKIKKGTIGIADGAFCGSKTLREVYLPSSIQKIGAKAFAEVQNLSYIKFMGATPEIKEGAFSTGRRDSLIRVIVQDDKILRTENKCSLAGNPYCLMFEDEFGNYSSIERPLMMAPLSSTGPMVGMILQDPFSILKSDVRRWLYGMLNTSHMQIRRILQERHYQEEVFITRVALLIRDSRERRAMLENLTLLDSAATSNANAQQMLTNIISQLMR